MLVVILIVLLLVCGFGWLNQYVVNAALLMYAMDKEYTPPSEQEMKACLLEAWKRVLHIKHLSDW